MTLWIILGIIAVVIIWAVSAYNGIVKLKNWVSEAAAQIDVQLGRRNDLIPNLVETVKGYAKHEQETLSQVIAMRNQLSGTLKTNFALSESYPDLKATTNFIKLQEELTNTENKIAYSRQLYNSSVAQYNIKIQMIPNNIIANFGGFTKEQMLEIPAEERAVPKVQF